MDALMLVDIQNDYFKGGVFPLAGMEKATKNAASLLEEFRSQGKPIIHIRHINEHPNAGFFRPESFGSEIHALVKPIAGETVLIKHYPNSFRETGLDALLKEQGIKTIHIVGAQTNMCIDTTTCAGFDLGYRMVLHETACAARGLFGTRLIHRITVKTLGSVFAEVTK